MASAAALGQTSRLLVGAPQRQQTARGRRPLQVAAAGSTFGHNFRVTTFGESHGGGVGCVIDGVPPRLHITKEEIQFELDRRRPGQSRITTPRSETDTCEILSGMAPDGATTLGTPICVLVRNKDQQSGDYSEIEAAYRPSHADATYDFKYGIRAVAGGGRSSARETIGRVAAGAVAKKLLAQVAGTEILAYVNRVRDVEATGVDHDTMTLADIEANPVRCPDQASADLMYNAIDEVRTRGESCGGEVTCVVRGCPKGLGAPVFDKLEAELAKAVMSLPASKGFEIGSGFSGSRMVGSEHNDEYYMAAGEIRTRTNRSGGVQGGISNGESIVIRVAFKPTATIARRQQTVSREGQDVELLARGRHDPCVVPRAAPMVESMVALVLADQLLQHYAQCELLPRDDALGPDARVRSQFSPQAQQQQLQHS
ncbi:chorismate synthase [Micractinium conductrix]|uniref:Chorismate synthase n=1 Tax=Micractinium conductrix TaxID=554055 RepID=A0A2P6VJ55_9CHLO|nr:chorismate synthase [Micractinium conductrix]|eukprot:PSC74108.1 chorismate synthase [Micractinium conductrix]